LIARAPLGLDSASKRVHSGEHFLAIDHHHVQAIRVGEHGPGIAARPAARSISQTSPECAGALTTSGPEPDLPQPPIPAVKRISRNSERRTERQVRCSH